MEKILDTMGKTILLIGRHELAKNDSIREFLFLARGRKHRYLG